MELSMLCGIKAQIVIEDVRRQKFVYYKSDERPGPFAPNPKIIDSVQQYFTNDDVIHHILLIQHPALVQFHLLEGPNQLRR